MSQATPTSQTLNDDTVDATGAGRPGRASIGGTVDRFVVLGSIGHGGMGVVYAAYDPELDRKIALKLLHGEGGVEARRRLTREAQAMAKLSHPNVAVVHDVGEHEGRVYVAMEFIEGATLRAWIKRERPGWARVLDVYTEAARGLAHAHARGLVHRDFKPDNVMLGDDGRVRVLDFGLASAPRDSASQPQSRAADDTTANTQGLSRNDRTLENSAAGTPAYMAPEQHLGLAADARSDEFSFCVALWEGVFGERPFGGDTVAALVMEVTDGRLRTPSRVRAVPGWLRSVLARGLSSDPDDRFPDIDALLSAIERGRRRPRRVVAGVAAVVAGCTIAAFVLADRVAQSRHAADCETLAERAAAVWSPEVREQTRAHFLATGSSYAGEAWERTAPWLDAWSAQFADLQRETCLAPDAPPPGADACFTEQLARIESLVSGLLEIEADRLPRAPGAAAILPRLELCTDPRRSAQRLDLPDDEAVRGQVADLRRQIQHGEALESLGRYDEGLAAARETLEQAIAVGWAPVQAEALLEVSALEQRTAAYDDAVAHAREAFSLAGRVGHDEVAAEAATVLVFMVGERLSRFSEGEAWAEIAEILLIRSGDDQGLRMANVYSNLGTLHHRSGALDLALADHQRGHALRESVLGDAHPLVAYSLANMGNVHYARNELTEARAAHEHALAIQQRVLGDQHPDIAASLNNLGSIVKAGGDRPAARDYFERAVDSAQRTLGPEHPLLAMALGNLANTERETGELDVALAHYEQALAIRNKVFGPDDPGLAYPLTGIGRVHVARAQPDQALGVLERAAALREAEGVSPGARAETQFALAQALAQLGTDRARAQSLAEAARLAFTELDDTERVAEIEAWSAALPQ